MSSSRDALPPSSTQPTPAPPPPPPKPLTRPLGGLPCFFAQYRVYGRPVSTPLSIHRVGVSGKPSESNGSEPRPASVGSLFTVMVSGNSLSPALRLLKNERPSSAR